MADSAARTVGALLVLCIKRNAIGRLSRKYTSLIRRLPTRDRQSLAVGSCCPVARPAFVKPFPPLAAYGPTQE